MEEFKICTTCDNCVYIGEGAFICDAQEEPVVVMEDFEPTDDHLICGGADWSSKEDE